MAKKPNTINKFAALVARSEGGKSNARMGDVAQVLKVANMLLGGKLYAAIREHYALIEGEEKQIDHIK